MKLPFEKLRDKKSRKGKQLFSADTIVNEETSAESALPGTHSKKKKRKKLKKKVAIPVALIVVLAGVFGVRHFFLSGTGAVTQTYTESEASRQDIQLTLSATGTIEPANQYDVTSSVQGEVLSCTFEEGDEVKKGDVMYEIDSTDAQNSIEQAQLSLQQSQNSYNQTVESLDDLNVKSDKSGVVAKLYVEVGDQVQAGATIADVRDSSTMELTVPFNASDAATFGVGSTATVTIDGSFETLTGTVTAIDAADTVLDGYFG